MAGRLSIRGVLLIGVIALAMSDRAARAQALQELRDDVRTSDPGPPDADAGDKPSRNASNNNSYNDGSDGSSGDDLFGMGLLLGVVAPFWGPPVLVGDDYSQPGYFAHFPHQYHLGYMLIGSEEAIDAPGYWRPNCSG
jgi:hypothetical protein